MLASKTFIVGGGAFQGIWEERAKTPIGFSDKASSVLPVSLGDLSATLPRELTNRFRAEVITLPKLSREDYRQMISRTAAQLQDPLRDTFLRLANERIEAAIQCQQGCRFLEEIILDSIICERELINDTRKPNKYPAFKDHSNAGVPGL